MRKLATSFATGLALLALTSAPAAAATITLDFGSASYAGAAGATSGSPFVFVDQGITVTLSPNIGSLTQDGLGIGIDSLYPDDDEIGGNIIVPEIFLSVLSPASSTLLSFNVARLFNNQDEVESGAYQVNGGPITSFTATSATGLLTVIVPSPMGGFNSGNVGSVRFGTIAPLGSEFTLSSLRLDAPAAIPEPASMLLLGSGLVGGIGALRRRKANAKK